MISFLIQGSTGQDPENCESDFPAIVRCMADGRNHVPCCIQERVPDICQDVCRGEYTAITDNIKTHFSCSAYTEQTLACIVEGIGMSALFQSLNQLLYCFVHFLCTYVCIMYIYSNLGTHYVYILCDLRHCSNKLLKTQKATSRDRRIDKNRLTNCNSSFTKCATINDAGKSDLRLKQTMRLILKFINLIYLSYQGFSKYLDSFFSRTPPQPARRRRSRSPNRKIPESNLVFPRIKY